LAYIENGGNISYNGHEPNKLKTQEPTNRVSETSTIFGSKNQYIVQNN